MSQTCPNCHSTQTIHLFNNPDYISGETFPINHCNDCGLAYTAATLTPDKLAQYYEADIYYGDEGKRFINSIESLIAWFRQARTRLILRHHPTPGNILDIGCGRGLMLAELKSRGWQSTGVEFSAILAQAGSKKHNITIHHATHLTDCQFDATSFDVVTLWHVLEHLLKPAATIQEIQRILKPNGLLIIEVPNLGSLQAKWSAGGGFHLDAPRHLYHFSSQSLQNLLENNGFKVIKQHTWSLEYGPYGLLQGLLNRITIAPNVLYCLLKRKSPNQPHYKSWQKAWDITISLLLLPLLGSLSLIVEIAAVMIGRGGIIQIIAQKTPPK